MSNNSPLTREALELAKRISHDLWERYDDKYGYRTAKQMRNENVPTDQVDNIWFFWNQFDAANQRRFEIAATRAYSDGKPGARELLNWVKCSNLPETPHTSDE